jgi:hypothetical protein
LTPVASLDRLPSAQHRTVIINCGTDLVTTLALASAHAYTDGPILLMNCGATHGSRNYFGRLSAAHPIAFSYLEWPLESHSVTLDALFRGINAETVLLLDSDLELRGPHIHEGMQRALAANAHAYGSGFLHRARWLGAANGLPSHTAFYAERMWIPCALLRTAPIRDALLAGASFSVSRAHFEFRRFPALARMAGYRFRVRGLRGLALSRSIPCDGSAPIVDGRRPRYIEYDTGARLHATLVARGLPFAALPESDWGDVAHFHGTTRRTRLGTLRRAAQHLRLIDMGEETEPASVVHAVRARLHTAYGITAP